MSTSFDRWIRGNAPVTHDDADDARHLWTRLEDRMHQRRQRRITRGSGLAAAAVIVLVLGVVDVNPLGGNNWNLIESSSREGFAEDPLTGKLYTTDITTDDGMIANVPAQLFWETVREQQAAGTYTLDAIDFYQVENEFQWALFNRHQIGPESKAATQDIVGGAEMSPKTLAWLMPHFMPFLEGNKDGLWREVEARRYSVNGQMYWFQVWSKDTDRGPIYYGTAVIPKIEN